MPDEAPLIAPNSRAPHRTTHYGRLAQLRTALVTRATYRTCRVTLARLFPLNDRDLDDVGLSRDMTRDVATPKAEAAARVLLGTARP